MARCSSIPVGVVRRRCRSAGQTTIVGIPDRRERRANGALAIMIAALALAFECEFATTAHAQGSPERAVEAAKERWASSPHGPMLERILPPTFAVTQLPEPGSRGAQLLVRYCVQCHYLSNPAMHEAEKWPKVVTRMVARIDGKGNMGPLMRDMMAGVQAPSADETMVLVGYLQKHAQRPIAAAKYPELKLPAGQSFRLACQQCHVLPDPARYTAKQWPAVVARMEQNMEWMNRVVGSQADPREPQLRIEEINAFLARHARKE